MKKPIINGRRGYCADCKRVLIGKYRRCPRCNERWNRFCDGLLPGFLRDHARPD